MSSNDAHKVVVEVQEVDLFREPDSEDDEYEKAQIKSPKFGPAVSEKGIPSSRPPSQEPHGGQKAKLSSNMTSRQSRSTLQRKSPSSDSNPGGQNSKRSSQEAAIESTGVKAAFGNYGTAKRSKRGPTATFSRKPTLRVPRSSQEEQSPRRPTKYALFKALKSESSDDDDDIIANPITKPAPGFKKIEMDFISSPENVRSAKLGFIKHEQVDESSLKGVHSDIPRFFQSGLDGSAGISRRMSPQANKFNIRSLPKNVEAEKKKPVMAFKNYDMEFANVVGDTLDADRERLQPATAIKVEKGLPYHLASCPICTKPVDKNHLNSLGRMSMEQQSRFCQNHQRGTAKEEWRVKGYPEIDWGALNSRVKHHHDFLQSVIMGEDSYFRRILDDKIECGKDRTLLKSTTNLTPGYYGSRGAQLITNNIMREFTRLLKERAVQDRVIMARGPVSFAQTVLVPEVTTLLIMEDMKVNEEKARQILGESAPLGEILHEEALDVVKKWERVEPEDEPDDGDEDIEYSCLAVSD
ncbi:RTC4-like domain-containing protein [Calycina marina]|uniref:Restriction of telomere capping protein 4 n=1 Tax=Calycina marina TaxID=1763456 RepID=A0A9P8CDQ4_9HELO|nr:RTC4-like domain-containing protein [Calycina marina]